MKPEGPYFHETTAEAAWHILDVYQKQLSQDREEAQIRVFDLYNSFACLHYTKYIISIFGLFQGQIINKPEHLVISTTYPSWGEVKHEVGVLLKILCQLSDRDLIQLFMIGGILFFVIEIKLGYEW